MSLEPKPGILDIHAYVGGRSTVPGVANPIKLSDAPVDTRRKSPMVGEHTAEIMREVGYSDGEIAALRDAKAIAVAQP